MAKKIAPKAAAAPAKKPATPKKKAASAKTSSKLRVEKVCEAALDKLKELNLDLGLQGEIEWCLGSYANDGNPVGLYDMAERALNEFHSVTATDPKAISAKLLADLQKAVESRP